MVATTDGAVEEVTRAHASTSLAFMLVAEAAAVVVGIHASAGLVQHQPWWQVLWVVVLPTH